MNTVGDQSGQFHGEKKHLSDLCKEVERRYKAYESKARIDLVEIFLFSNILLQIKKRSHQRYFVDLFSIDLFHCAVVDAVDGEVHEEDGQKVIRGARGPADK